MSRTVSAWAVEPRPTCGARRSTTGIARVATVTVRRGRQRHQHGRDNVDREELKAQIEELMRQYQDEEIDGETYARQMIELTTSAQE